MSRKGTSAIYKPMYYLEIVMQSLPPSGSFVEFQHTFLIRKCFVQNVFGTPVWPPQSLAWDRGLWVARNTFLWVLSTHKNFTEDWTTLRKSVMDIVYTNYILLIHLFTTRTFDMESLYHSTYFLTYPLQTVFYLLKTQKLLSYLPCSIYYIFLLH